MSKGSICLQCALYHYNLRMVTIDKSKSGGYKSNKDFPCISATCDCECWNEEVLLDF